MFDTLQVFWWVRRGFVEVVVDAGESLRIEGLRGMKREIGRMGKLAWYLYGMKRYGMAS
jgi:hypothetical protein